MATENTISKVRSLTFLVTGLLCVAYAGLALMTGTPEPFPWWIPGIFGVLSAVLITLSATLAGDEAADRAMDELYTLVNHKAQRHAYWVSLALFVVISTLSVQGVIAFPIGFAVLGTAMGASYLLLFVWYDWRTG